MDGTIERVLLIIIFCLLFAALGWLIPTTYAMYAPQDAFVEMNSFEVNDTVVGSDSHVMRFDRTAYRPSEARVYTELLKTDSDVEVELLSDHAERNMQEGRSVVVVENEIPNHVPPGEYYYQRTYRVSYANGMVERVFTFESERFYIHPNRSCDRKT